MNHRGTESARRSAAVLLATFFALAPSARGQTPPPSQELLALVPKDVSFCLVVNDLRGHWQRLEQAPWLKSLKQSPLGQAILHAPQGKDLARFERNLKQHLDIDWRTVRDDLVGDAVVFAYRAPSAPGDSEQGLVLIKTRRPEVLERLIGWVNDLQTKSGELQALEPRLHQGARYYRRAHARNVHFYAVQGPVFALTSSEPMLQAVLAKNGDGAAIQMSLRRAEADRSLVALWLNPRAFDSELGAKAKAAVGPEAHLLKGFLAHWQALDAAVVTLDVKDSLELRLSLFARSQDLPAAAKAWFASRSVPSGLWQRFPANSVFALAGRTDFQALADGLLEATPAEVRRLVVDTVSKNVGAALGLDPFKDVLPNLGPDWGVCVLPAEAGKEFPQALAALAVKAGDEDHAVDQTLYQSTQFLAWLLVLQHNRTHDDKIVMRTTRQNGVEIKYLTQDRLFPAGFQPAWALKDGYLLLATSPAAMAQFQPHKGVIAPADEAPLVRIAPAELARLLRHQRERVLEQMMKKQSAQSKDAVARELDTLLALLDACQSVTLSQRSGDGQLTWRLRLQMTP